MKNFNKGNGTHYSVAARNILPVPKQDALEYIKLCLKLQDLGEGCVCHKLWDT